MLNRDAGSVSRMENDGVTHTGGGDGARWRAQGDASRNPGGSLFFIGAIIGATITGKTSLCRGTGTYSARHILRPIRAHRLRTTRLVPT